MDFQENGRAMFISDYGHIVNNHINVGETLINKCLQAKIPIEHSEKRSWEKSLPALFNRIANCTISSSAVFMCEYNIFGGSRIDWLAIGTDKLGVPTIIIGENKQWTNWHLHNDGGKRTASIVIGNSQYDEREEPIQQLECYKIQVERLLKCDKLLSELYNKHGVKILCVAYLHNAKDVHEFKDLCTDGMYAFSDSSEDNKAFEELLSYNLYGGDSIQLGQLLYDCTTTVQFNEVNIFSNAIVASNKYIKNEKNINFKLKYILNSEQNVLVANGIRIYLETRKNDGGIHKKHMVLIQSYEGSGKTICAICLFYYFLLNGKNVAYSVKTAEKRAQIVFAVHELLDEYYGKKYTPEKKLMEREMLSRVIYLGNGVKNVYDILIVDEAQTLHKYISVPVFDEEGNPVMNGKNRVYKDDKGNQDSYVLNCMEMVTDMAFFFYDEHQKDEPQCFLTTEALKEYAADKIIDVHELTLNNQVRCGGIGNYSKLLAKFIYGDKYDGSFKIPSSNTFHVFITEKYGDLTFWLGEIVNKRVKDVKKCHINACWSKEQRWHKDQTKGFDFNNLYYCVEDNGVINKIPYPMNWNFRPDVRAGKPYNYSEDCHKTVGYLSNVIGSEYKAVYLMVPRVYTYNKELHCLEVHDELNGRTYNCDIDEYYTSIKELLKNELYINLGRATNYLVISCENENLRNVLAYLFNVDELV